MNKVRSTVKHMPRKAKLLTALLACVLVLTLIGVGIAAEVESGTKFFRGTTIKICDNQIGVTTNALDWTDKHNFDKFSVNEAGTWTHENATKITGSVESWYDGAMVPAKTAITLQNLSDNEAVVFSFDYKEEYSGFQQCRGYVKIGSEDATTGKGSYTVTLQPKQSISVSISTTQYNREVAEGAIPKETIELSNFSVAATDQKSITLKPAANGSYTVKSGNQSETVTAQDENKTFSYKSTDGITVTATPNKGYKFALLRDDDTPLTTNAGENSATVYPNGNVLSALFVEDSQKAPFHIERENEDESYYYWEDAMRASVAKNNAPVVMDIDNQGRTYSLPTSAEEIGLSKNKYVITNEDGKVEYTIPADVTLVVPYSAAHSVSGNNMVNTDASSGEFHHEGVTASVGTAYATLTVPEGTALSVNGTLLIDALQGGKNGQPYTSCVVGNYGKMIVGGTVKVNTGGTLYAYGYVVDKNHTQENHVGKIDVSGGTLTQMLQIADWRGGNYGANCNKNNYNVFPFSIYYLQNNMVPTTYSYGSAMKARAAIAGGGTVMYDTVSVIGNGEEKNPSIFDMAAGATVETDYSYSNDQLLVKLIGSTSMNCLKLKAGDQASMDTKNMELAISDNMQITVSGGTMAINYGLKFLPGASLTVEENGNLNITASNGRAFFYGKDDYIDAFAYGKWRTRLQGEGIIDKPGQTIKPTKDAELNLKGGLTISGDLALSSNHSGLTPGSKAATVTVNKILPTGTYLLEPCKDNYITRPENNTNTAYGMPDLTNGLSYVAITSFSEENKDTLKIVGWHNILAIQNKNWTGPKGVMADGTSAAVMNAASPANTYKACEKNDGSLAWYNRVVTCDYSNKDIPATKLYIGSQTASFKAPEVNGTKYVITGITTGNTGIAYANGGGDANAISDGVTSVKLSNIVQAENTLTATVKSYEHDVTWVRTTTEGAETKTTTTHSYLPSGTSEATLTFDGKVNIDASKVKIDGNAAGSRFTSTEKNSKTVVTVTGIAKDTRIEVPYSSSNTVTWVVTTDKGDAVTTKAQTVAGSATYSLGNNTESKNWKVVELDGGVSIEKSSDSKAALKTRTDKTEDITVTDVLQDITVNITVTTYAHKVTTNTTVYDADKKNADKSETIEYFTNDATYKPALTKIGQNDKYVVSAYTVTGGTLESKGSAEVCAVLPDAVAIDMSNVSTKETKVDLTLQSYLYVWNWDATLDGKKMETNSGFTYTEYLTDRTTGENYTSPFYMQYPYYLTLRDYGVTGKYYYYNDNGMMDYGFGIDYRSMGNNRFVISGDQNLPDYPGAVMSPKNGVLSAASEEAFTLNDTSVTVALVSYATKVTVKDGTKNMLPEGIFYANADGKDATSGEEIVYGAFDYNDAVEWEYYNKQLFVKGYTIGIDGAESTTPVNNVGALLGDRFTVDARLNGLTISADTVKSAAGSGSGKDLTVTLTDLAKYYQVYAFSEDDGKSYSKLLFVQEQQNGEVEVYAPKLEDTYDVSCSYTQDTYYYHPQLTVKNGVSSFIQKTESRQGRSISSNGKTLKMEGGSGSGVFTPKFTLTPYTKSLTWNVGNESGTTYVTSDGKAYCGLNEYKTEMLVDNRYSDGTWTYTVPTGKTVAPNGLTHNRCDAVYEGGKVTVSKLEANSTVSITTSAEIPTEANTSYYMGDMSFEYVRNAAAFTWDGKTEGGGSWKPVNAFGWRHAVGSKSYEVDGKTLTVDNGSILFVNTMQNTPVTYTVQLSTKGNTNYGVSLVFDQRENIQVNDGVATVTVPANSRVTLVCRMTGTPDFSSGNEIEIGTITVTRK